MLDLLPHRAFFQFELRIPYWTGPKVLDGSVEKWPDETFVPALCYTDMEDPFADLYWAWNDDAFLFAFDVLPRRHALQVDRDHWWKKDGVRICIDTRDARDNKRATRFCHFFYVLPTGGGSDKKHPVVGTHRMSRAKEPPPNVDVKKIKTAVAHHGGGGYTLQVAIPTHQLFGWDPLEHPRIGVFLKVKDIVRGSQNLTVTDELGWNADPSTWATAVLSSDGRRQQQSG